MPGQQQVHPGQQQVVQALPRAKGNRRSWQAFARVSGSPLQASHPACMQMATLDSAEKLLEELRAASYECGKAELQETRDFAKEQGADYDLMNWDVSFWSERMKEAKFDINDEQLRPYFALPNVLDGLFAVRLPPPLLSPAAATAVSIACLFLIMHP